MTQQDVVSSPVARGTGTDLWIDVPLFLSLATLPWSRSLTTVCWGLLALVLLWRIVRREFHAPRTALYGFMVFLTTWGISSFGTLDPRTTWLEWEGWAGMCVPFVAILGRRRGAGSPGWLAALWPGSSLLGGLWLLGEMLTGHRVLSGHYPGLAFPMLVNPNTAAQYSLLLFAWTFALACSARSPGGLALRAAGCAAAVGLLAAGGSRASWPAFVAVAGFLSWRYRRPIMGIAAGLFFGALNFAFPRMIWDRAVQLGSFEDVSIRGRILGWAAALRMFAERPFTGEGLGAWSVAYVTARRPGYPVDWPHAHSFYLNTLAETGFLGLAGVLVLLLPGFRPLWRRGLGPGPVPFEARAMTALLFGYMIVGMFDLAWVAEPGYAFFALSCYALCRVP